MTPNQIGVLATEGESETLEFKKTTGERREAAKTMCAMLNTRGGRIVFGITKEGSVAGQLVSDQTIEDVSAEIQRIDPPTFPTIDRIPLGGRPSSHSSECESRAYAATHLQKHLLS